MIFSKFFHLSREGSKTIMQAGIWLAVFNLAALLPVVLLAMISEDMMAKHFAGVLFRDARSQRCHRYHYG